MLGVAQNHMFKLDGINAVRYSLRQGLAAIGQDDKDALLAFGIEFAVQQCAELLKAGAPGLHIYTMDRSLSAEGIVTRLRDMNLL